MAVQESWTSYRVLGLAPDSSAAVAGRNIANPAKWVAFGRDDERVWGEAKGSGANPYQTAVDLAAPAYKCSSPSRKIPCKHVLGLLLLYAEQHIETAAAPPWVVAWTQKRAASATTKETKASKAKLDEKGKAARAEKRKQKVEAGLADCDRWLRDGVRQGLATLQSQPAKTWKEFSARMVDAQAPGIARLIREMGSAAVSGEGWQSRLLEKMGRLHLLLQAYSRIEVLPTGIQSDIRTLIGWTTMKDDLRDELAVSDVWSVLGQHAWEEDKLKVQASWLQGAESKRIGLVLSYSAASQPFDFATPPGLAFQGTLHYYPSAYALRAAVSQAAPSAFAARLEGAANRVQDNFTAALGANPWLEVIPAALGPALLVQEGERWRVEDSDGKSLPIDPSFEGAWTALAVTCGRPAAFFGEWNGRTFLPLGVAADRIFCGLGVKA
jgi:hypothetical protein